MIDYVKELLDNGTVTVPKEVGQAAGTFTPGNAACMVACSADCNGFWSIHPSVKRDLFMWGVYHLRSPFVPGDPDSARLFGLPVRFELEDRSTLGTVGDVVFLCKAGHVNLQTRD